MVAVLSLCSGIGGLDLAVKLAIPAARTIAYVEREAFCCEVLAARMEEGALDMAPIWSDIESFDGKALRGKVDLVIAGFPCQAFSSAARGRNREDRDIWLDVSRVIDECEPAFVFLENVALDAFRAPFYDLRSMGFVVPPLFEADPAELGAPHSRRRFFLLAHADGEGELECSVDEKVARVSKAASAWNGWPQLPRVDDGVPHRMDRARALGNAVIPVAAAHALIALIERRSKHQ